MGDFVGVLLVNAVERHLCESRRLDLIEIGSGHKASGYHEGEKSEPDHACYLNRCEGRTTGCEVGRGMAVFDAQLVATMQANAVAQKGIHTLNTEDFRLRELEVVAPLTGTQAENRAAVRREPARGAPGS